MDSMRFFAVALIILFHFLELVGSPGGAIDGGYFATWPLRVPLLLFVAGWFSSAEPPTRRSITRLLQSVVVVYVIFDGLQRVQRYLLGEYRGFDLDDRLLDFGHPIFGMWFLLTLATMRLLLPYLARIRWFGVIACLGALVVGLTDAGPTFSLSRTFAFLPIFLLGWYARQAGLRERLTSAWARLVAAGVLLGSLLLGWRLNGVVGIKQIGLGLPYQDDVPIEMAWRAGFLLWAAVTVIAVLALMPTRRIPLISACGAGSMYAYLLHQFVVRQWASNGGAELVTSPLAVVAVAVAALLLSVVLMLPSVRPLFRPLVQPRWEWFLRDREPISDVSRRPLT